MEDTGRCLAALGGGAQQRAVSCSVTAVRVIDDDGTYDGKYVLFEICARETKEGHEHKSEKRFSEFEGARRPAPLSLSCWNCCPRLARPGWSWWASSVAVRRRAAPGPVAAVCSLSLGHVPLVTWVRMQS